MYKTQYAAALAANNLTSEDLYTKTRVLLDDVISLEKDLKEVQESLTDAEPDDIPGIQQNIDNLSTILANQDKFVCEKINETPALKLANKEKMAKAQGARKFNKKDNGGKEGGDNTNTASDGTGKAPVVDINKKTETKAEEGKQVPGSTEQPKQATENKSDPPPKKAAEQKKETGGKVNWGAIIAGGFVTIVLGASVLTAFKKGWWPFKKN